MGKVEVLLSTYNGEKYLEEQIDSLLKQNYSDIGILIRDDGSTDRTVEILNKYANCENIKVINGENRGVISSFFELLACSSDECEYVAFCDQDDIWKNSKITSAVKKLERVPSHIPAMYCSQVEIVDETLHPMGKMPEPTQGPSLENALLQNIAIGCTIILNNKAKRLLLEKFPEPSRIIMHDWWIYLVVSAFGEVIYDSEPHILYRQHNSNSIGTRAGIIGKWQVRIKQFINRGSILFLTRQALEFRDLYGNMLLDKQAHVLNKFIDGRKTVAGRMHYAFFGDAYRQTMLDNIIFRILILLNRV